MEEKTRLRTDILLEMYKEINNDSREAGRQSVMISSFIIPALVVAAGAIIQYQVWHAIPALSGLLVFFSIWLLGCYFAIQNSSRENEIIRNQLDKILRNDVTDSDFSLVKLHRQIERASREEARAFVPFMYVALVSGMVLSAVSFWAESSMHMDLAFIIGGLFFSLTSALAVIFFFRKVANRNKIFAELA